MSKERRQHSRITFPKIRVRVPRGRKYRDEFMRDLSAGGLFVSTTKTLPLGSEVQIQLISPSEEEDIELTGSVLRVKDEGPTGTGMAVEFKDLTPELSDRLASLIVAYQEAGEAEDRAAADGSDDAGESAAKQPAARTEELLAEIEETAAALEQRDRELEKALKQGEALSQRIAKLEAQRDELLGDKVALETELETAQQTSTIAADLDEAKRENERLSTRLRESGETALKLEAELNQHREDEEMTRNLAERLAKEKLALDQAAKQAKADTEALRTELSESRASAKEVASIRQRLERTEEEAAEIREELERTLEEERAGRAEADEKLKESVDRLKDLKGRGEQVEELETKLRKATLDAEEAREKAEWSEERAIKALDELESARARERDLRRLLAAVSDDKRVEPADDDEGGPAVGEFIEEEPDHDADAAPDTDAVEVTAKIATISAAAGSSSGEWELEANETADDQGAGKDDGRDQTRDETTDKKTAAAARAAAKSEAAKVFDDETDGPETVTSLDEFHERLGKGATLVLTPRFRRLEPVSRADIQVSDWLKEATTLKELKKLARGNMAAKELSEVLYLFFERALIRLER